MATLLERIRKQIKDRNIRTFGTINETTEKKLKKKGLTNAEIKKLKKQDPKGSKTINEKELKKSASKPAAKSKSAPRGVDKGGRLSARGSEGYKPTNTKIGPNMGKVNKPAKARAKKVDLKKRGPSGPMMTSMKAPSTGPTPRNKDPKQDRKKSARNQMKSARASMGFKKGGRIDGCATRGLTRAKRSR